jgi:hypothetical protein
MNDYTHHIYNFGQPCLNFLASCTRITYENYNTTRINEALISNFFVTTILNFCATTQLLIAIIIIIIILIISIIIVHCYINSKLLVNIESPISDYWLMIGHFWIFIVSCLLCVI